jgi:hypothetical protein
MRWTETVAGHSLRRGTSPPASLAFVRMIGAGVRHELSERDIESVGDGMPGLQRGLGCPRFNRYEHAARHATAFG